MPSLPSRLRKKLEDDIQDARQSAEFGARKALEALAVHEADPYRHMDDAQRMLRRKLRAQARQLGDVESRSRPGTYDLKHLAEKVAYDQWHRLLFARFLLENNLLISPAHQVAVTLADCEELAPSLGLKDAWAVAGRFTAALLPEAFRPEDPAAAVDLPIEERNQLLRLLTGLPAAVFTATDSLGWTYQFWQAKRKEEVNDSGNKIGADELPSITQLFTEDYMVDFLLDNTLGAWHAGKILAANPKLAENAESEDELRQACALPGCPWNYLRFIKGKNNKWTPAAGTFDGWPKSAAALRALDPCMGSGHFVVAMFERLVALRLAEENLDEAAAVAAVRGPKRLRRGFRREAHGEVVEPVKNHDSRARISIQRRQARRVRRRHGHGHPWLSLGMFSASASVQGRWRLRSETSQARGGQGRRTSGLDESNRWRENLRFAGNRPRRSGTQRHHVQAGPF